MNIIFVEDELNKNPEVGTLLEQSLGAVVHIIPSLQQGIDVLQNPKDPVDLVVCDYHGRSMGSLKVMLGLCSKIPCILVVDDKKDVAEVYRVLKTPLVESVERKNIKLELTRQINYFRKNGYFKTVKNIEADFIGVPTRILSVSGDIKADIFIRLGENRYCKLFREGDTARSSSLDEYFKKKGLDRFYIRKSEAAEFLEKESKLLQKLLDAKKLVPEEARVAVEGAYEVVHDIIQRLGFTPAVQQIALKTVTLTLKMIGTKPKLVPILSRLKKEKGKYISSHSIMVAEIGCAIAARIGWNSVSTFQKMTLAAFLHDLTIQDNRVAQFRTLDEAKVDPAMTKEILAEFRAHPTRAAEMVKQLHDIPPDVDTMLVQHHERPDGRGFPRGLHAQQFSPLSCLFIVAHDMFFFFMETKGKATVENFLDAKEEYYDVGGFRKIMKSLRTGVAAPGASGM